VKCACNLILSLYIYIATKLTTIIAWTEQETLTHYKPLKAAVFIRKPTLKTP